VCLCLCVFARAFVSGKNLPQSLPQGCLTFGFCCFCNWYMELLKCYADVYFINTFRQESAPMAARRLHRATAQG
jgi:hypothetical protein